MIDISKVAMVQNSDGSCYPIDKVTRQPLGKDEQRELIAQFQKGAKFCLHEAALSEVKDLTYWWHWSGNYADLACGDCVYFISGGTDKPGLIKIGKSSMLDKRLTALRREHGKSLIPILWIPVTDMYYAETVLHEMFKDFRVAGEWFTATPILAFIEQNRGT